MLQEVADCLLPGFNFGWPLAESVGNFLDTYPFGLKVRDVHTEIIDLVVSKHLQCGKGGRKMFDRRSQLRLWNLPFRSTDARPLQRAGIRPADAKQRELIRTENLPPKLGRVRMSCDELKSRCLMVLNGQNGFIEFAGDSETPAIQSQDD